MTQDIIIALVGTLFGALVSMVVAAFTIYRRADRNSQQLGVIDRKADKLETELAAVRKDLQAMESRIGAEARRLEIQFKDEVEGSRHRLIDTAIQPLVARMESQWAIRFDDHESRIRTLEGTERRGRGRTLPEEG